MRQDFLGFSFNGVHSSDLGLLVVSNGNRYLKNLLPPQSDTTINVPGRDGSLYLGSTYQSRSFSISAAFDNMTEEQIRLFRLLFKNQGIGNLSFDEEPYKIYRAKISGVPTLSFICFDERGRRIYKGESQINFVCYDPFAKSRYKYLQDYRKIMYLFSNVDEWASASGMRESQDDLDTYSSGSIKLFNAGDFDTDHILTFNRKYDIIRLRVKLGEKQFSINFADAPQGQNGDTFLISVNSRKKLITQKINDGSEVCINNCQGLGQIFKIPIGESQIDFTIIGSGGDTPITNQIENVEIDYSYLYL